MNQYVLLMRGINVAGHRKIKMIALRQQLQDLNFTNIQTYIQSGNILLKSKLDEKHIENIVAKAVFDHYGFDVSIIVFTWKDWEKQVLQMPFYEPDNEKFIHCTYLQQRPPKAQIKVLNPKLSEGEAFEIIDRTIYLYCPNGYGRTKLTNTYWETQLSTIATTRNWKTTKKLTEMRQK